MGLGEECAQLSCGEGVTSEEWKRVYSDKGSCNCGSGTLTVNYLKKKGVRRWIFVGWIKFFGSSFLIFIF